MVQAMSFGLLIGLLLTSLGSPVKVPAVVASPAAQTGNQAVIPSQLWTPEPRDRRSCQSDQRASRHLVARKASLRGVKNINRLLPVAKGLTSEALRSAGLRYGLPAIQIEGAARRITAARRVLLDNRLSDTAMVDARSPSAIRVGPLCAEALVSDDLAVFIVAHELTHVANSRGDLQALAGCV